MAKFNSTRLVMARELAGLSPGQFAKVMEIMPQQVTLWENGMEAPTDEDFEKLCGILSFPPGFFFRDDPPIPANTTLFWHDLWHNPKNQKVGD